jgi:hypothetical protein
MAVEDKGVVGLAEHLLQQHPVLQIQVAAAAAQPVTSMLSAEQEVQVLLSLDTQILFLYQQQQPAVQQSLYQVALETIDLTDLGQLHFKLNNIIRIENGIDSN